MHRLGYVDGLRAVAVLTVVYLHGLSIAHIVAPVWIIDTVAFGAHGVDLFFVISGFCLAYPSLARVRSEQRYELDVPGYVARRLLRIPPPYWAAILVLFAGERLGVFQPSGGAAIHDVIAQILFMNQWGHMLSSAFWTLPIEFRWYFLFPALLWLYVRMPRAFAVLGILCPIVYLTTPYGPVDLGTIATFMLGIWLADLQITESPLRSVFGLMALPLLALAIVLEPSMINARFIPKVTQGFIGAEPIAAFGMFCFAAGAGTFGRLRRLLELRLVRFIGLISYSVYLLHLPIIDSLEHNLHVQPVLAATIAIVLSVPFWYAVEFPLTQTSLRIHAARALEAPFIRIFKHLRISPSIALSARGVLLADGDPGYVARAGD
jgi:peptidoglycan/LPS O-acetylase OafA/YrhL